MMTIDSDRPRLYTESMSQHASDLNASEPSSIGELDVVLLDEERLREVFDHDFHTADGKHWQSSIAQPVIGPQGFEAHVEGDILCDGSIVGHFTRTVNLRRGNFVRHQDIHLEAAYQSCGFGRSFNTLCAQGYATLGIERITLKTGADGLATWPRLGFDLAMPPRADHELYEIAMQEVLEAAREGLKKITDVELGDKAQAIYDEVASRRPLPRLGDLTLEHPEWTRLVFEGAKIELAASTIDLANS